MSCPFIYAIKYAFETLVNAKKFSRSIASVSQDPKVSEYLRNYRIYQVSAMGLLGIMFYDMAVGKNGNKQERELVGRFASRIILLTDIVDDILDRRMASIDEKNSFLDQIKSTLFGYSQEDRGRNTEEKACYALAREIYEDFIYMDRSRSLENIFNVLVEVIKRQFTETDPQNLLIIANTIGACCADATAVLTEIVKGEDYPQVREAARKMGQYAQLLDTWYELDNDVVEGVNTYATVRIREEGDYPYVRKDIKDRLLSIADESVSEGFGTLSSERQRKIYRAMKIMMDIKYRVLSRIN